MGTPPKYPAVEVQLSREDGNAMAIMARVSRALAKAEVGVDEVKAFRAEALSGDYDNVIATCWCWVTIS